MATKMACSVGGCKETMTHTQHQLRQICDGHWQMLPSELQKEILAARHHGPRERANQLTRAKQWLAQPVEPEPAPKKKIRIKVRKPPEGEGMTSSGFDLKNETPEIPKHFKALCQGRMVRYAYVDGKTRPAMVVDVIDKAAGIIELQIFWGQNLAQAVPIDEGTGAAGVVRYHPEGKVGTWHWPPHEG